MKKTVSTFLIFFTLGIITYYGFYFVSNRYKSSGIQELKTTSGTIVPPVSSTKEEHQPYQKLSAKITTDPLVQSFIEKDPKKIQVIEFFNYGCFWCERLEPLLQKWLKHKSENVVFYRFPVIFHKNWEPLAKAFYVVKILGKSEKLDSKFFEAIYKKRLNLSDEKLLTEFFVQNGVPAKEFLDLYKSFAVTHEVQNGDKLSNAYEVVNSPAFIVNAPSGSYLFTSAMVDGEEAKLFTVLDELIAQELKALK